MKRLFSPKLFLVILLFALLVLGRNIYRVSYEKYQINKKISNVRAELDALEKRGEDLKMLVGRLQNKEYLEKEARRRLQFQREGEKSFIITPVRGSTQSAQIDEDKQVLSPQWLENPKKWFDMFFARD